MDKINTKGQLFAAVNYKRNLFDIRQILECTNCKVTVKIETEEKAITPPDSIQKKCIESMYDDLEKEIADINNAIDEYNETHKDKQ